MPTQYEAHDQYGLTTMLITIIAWYTYRTPADTNNSNSRGN